MLTFFSENDILFTGVRRIDSCFVSGAVTENREAHGTVSLRCEGRRRDGKPTMMSTGLIGLRHAAAYNKIMKGRIL